MRKKLYLYSMKDIQLPPRSDGSRATVAPHRKRLVIIGANGAGKTRFTERLVADSPAGVFRMSALNALYHKYEPDPLPGSIDERYDEAVRRLVFLRDDVISQFDRLMTLLMFDEMSALINYKLRGRSGNRPERLPKSRLDLVINAWQEIFPANKVLRASGKLNFSRHGESDIYSSHRLSDGEKTVLYYFGAALYAPKGAYVYVDSPTIFLHPALAPMVWDRVEQARPDCTFIYTTHDIDFVTSRNGASVVWVKGYDATSNTWDYTVLPPDSPLADELYISLMGTRKPVLFIEGDSTHSIDAKLYPLVFTDYTVRSLGSCDKVIEATRTFNDLSSLHHLESRGIVDRDRRSAPEVDYLRRRRIFVPDVAEIENILMLEEVIRTVASCRGKNENKVAAQVRRSVINQFRTDLKRQALLHTRHRVKRMTECRIDGKFPDITSLERHLAGLVNTIKPRAMYEELCHEFQEYLAAGDYKSILRVYNQKSMLPSSNVAGLCGLSGKEEYIDAIINILKRNGAPATRIRAAIIDCFGIREDEASAPRPEITDLGND